MLIKVPLEIEIEISELDNEIIKNQIQSIITEMINNKVQLKKLIQPALKEAMEEHMVHYDILDQDSTINAVDDAIKPMIVEWIKANKKTIIPRIGKQVEDSLSDSLDELIRNNN